MVIQWLFWHFLAWYTRPPMFLANKTDFRCSWASDWCTTLTQTLLLGSSQFSSIISLSSFIPAHQLDVVDCFQSSPNAGYNPMEISLCQIETLLFSQLRKWCQKWCSLSTGVFFFKIDCGKHIKTLLSLRSPLLKSFSTFCWYPTPFNENMSGHHAHQYGLRALCSWPECQHGIGYLCPWSQATRCDCIVSHFCIYIRLSTNYAY